MRKTNPCGRTVLMWGCAVIALLIQWTVSAQELVHEYSFSDTPGTTNVCADSIGGAAWDGLLMNGGTNAFPGLGPNGLFTGSQLILSGQDEDYVQLPPGILSNYTAVTLDTWVTLGTLPNNCFLWGFGDTDTNVNGGNYGAGYNYIFCQPLQGRIAITGVNPGWQGEQSTADAGTLANGAEIHVTAVFDPPAGYEALYTNGVLAERQNITVQMDQISNVVNYLGRSLYYPDSYYDSSWDEFRIWDGALNPLQVAACDVNGPDNTNDSYGTITSLQLSFPQYQMPEGTHQSATVIAQASALPNPVDISHLANYSSSDTNILTVSNNVVYAVGQGQANIIASYGGVSSTQTIMAVAPSAPVLVHRYSFSDVNGSTTVADSVGGSAWNGTVMSDGANAVPTGGAFTNGVLWLSAAITNYVQLPPGILSNYPAVTIEGWVMQQTPMSAAYHAMYYAFGNTTNGLGYNYIFGSLPRDYTAITAGTYSSEQGTVEQDYSLTTNTLIHWTAVYNPPAGYIAVFTNGVLQSVNRSITDPMSVVSPLEAYIGRSLYPGDPYASISLDEFRIWDGALSPQEIAISDAAGPNSIPSTVTNGPGSFESMTLEAPNTLQPLQAAPLKVLANYAYLTNFDLAGDSIFPPTGLTITSSDTNVVTYDPATAQITGVSPGTATITASYQGITSTQQVTVVAPTAQLVHDYHFNEANGSTSVVDSVGGPAWNGMVMSDGTNAVPTGGAFTNGLLYLSAAVSNYVQLPGGILSNYTAVTIETWANMTSFPVNSYLWSFGDTDLANTNTYSSGLPSGCDLIFCAPQVGNITISDADPSWQGGIGLNDQDWSGRTNFHLAVVFNPPAHYMAIYTNGVLAAINTSETLPMSSVSNVFSYIGRSLYYADPFATFAIDEFRLYDGALTPAEVATNQLLGPNVLPVTHPVLNAAVSGGNVILSWPGSATGFTLESRSSLTTGTWTTNSSPAQLVGNQWQVTVPKSGAAAYFRLVQ